MSVLDDLLNMYKQASGGTGTPTEHPTDAPELPGVEQYDMRAAMIKRATPPPEAQPTWQRMLFGQPGGENLADVALNRSGSIMGSARARQREDPEWIASLRQSHPTLGTALSTMYGMIPTEETLVGGVGAPLAAAPLARKGAQAALPAAKSLLDDLPTQADRMAMKFVAERGRPPIEILSARAEGGPIAQLELNRKIEANKLYKKASGSAEQPLPEELVPSSPTFSPNDNALFQERDVNLIDYYFGTPASVTARSGSYDGYKVAAEQSLVEHSINTRIIAKDAADVKARAGLLPIEQSHVYRLLDNVQEGTLKLDEALAKMSPSEQQLALYQRGKYDQYRGEIITRLRDQVRPGIEKAIRKSMGPEVEIATSGIQPVFGEIIERDIGRRVDAAVEKRVQDTWGIHDYIARITPGDYVITNKQGKTLDTAATLLERDMKIEQMVADGMDVADIKTKNRVFLDAELLSKWNKRKSGVISDYAKAGELTEEQVAKVAAGEYGPTGHEKFFANLLKREGTKGYSEDLALIDRMYNRRFERWVQLSDLSAKVEPEIAKLSARGYTLGARMLDANMKALWGYRPDISIAFDNFIKSVPIVNKVVPSYALERWTGALKTGLVAGMIKYKPSFHAANATQLMTTLWPIADASEIAKGVQMFASKEGRALIQQYGGYGSRTGSKIGIGEDFNQGVAFLTMFNRAKQFGLAPEAAADYGILRGNIYSQFHSLMTDRPQIFRKYDPTGVLSMFQRFMIKQTEQLVDLVKDHNVSGAAKWLSTIALMGGYKGLTMGSAGWLGYRGYKMIKDEYGQTAADVIHYGLPGLAGVDMSGTAMAFHPPFGDSVYDKLGGLVAGPVGSLATSTIGAAMNTKAIDPDASSRITRALIQGVPLAKEFDAVRRIMLDDYNMRTTDGKLKYRADVWDLTKLSLGFKPIGNFDGNKSTFASMELWADALTTAKGKREDVVDYAASRYGQAALSGMGLPAEMQKAIVDDVNNWNALWGNEFPITGADVMTRARMRAKAAQQSLGQRLQKAAGKAGRAPMMQGGSNSSRGKGSSTSGDEEY